MSNEIQISTQNENASLMGLIEKLAGNSDVSVDKMEKILDMQERILNRNGHQAFTSSLARMQHDLPTVIERGKAHNSKYATLEDITEIIRPILQEYGFAVTFRIDQDEKFITIIAVLSHEQGHSEKTSIRLPADTSGSKNAVQAIGSTVSYGKRYTICALLNITSRGEDDDAAIRNPIVTSEQGEIIKEKLMKCSPEMKEQFSKSYSKIGDVPKNSFDKVIAKLNGDINKGVSDA